MQASGIKSTIKLRIKSRIEIKTEIDLIHWVDCEFLAPPPF